MTSSLDQVERTAGQSYEKMQQQLSEYPLVDVTDILPADFEGRARIEIPPYAFRPDGWTRVFLIGLSKLDLQGAKVAEIGTGTGINAIALLGRNNGNSAPDFFQGSDLDPRLPSLAQKNVQRVLPADLARRFEPIMGPNNLASWVDRNNGVPDMVIACIPQVPAPKGLNMTEKDKDNLANYYEVERGNEDSDANLWGLGLNQCLLQQVADFLPPREGSVVLNLGGRPGIGRLFSLFNSSGFNPRILYQQVVAQHAETSLQSLATLEKVLGIQYEFFKDPDGKEAIGAIEAEKRRIEGLPVFHFIYVIQGVKN